MPMNEGDIAFIFLAIITIVGGIFIAYSDGSLGAGTPIWEPDEPINYVATQSQSKNVARGPNNVVYRTYIASTAMALNVSYTSDNGTSWNDTEIIDASWKGHTTLVLGGICILANNTTIVHFVSNGADDNYNSYLAIRWNWSGAWEIFKVYGSTTTGMSYPKMAVNTTKVLLMYYTTSSLRFKIFDPILHTFHNGNSTLPENWLPAADANLANFDITVNQSGYFIIAGQTWSGSVYRYYIRDLAGTHAVLYANIWSGVITTYCVNIKVTSDDCFSVSCTIYWSGSSYYGLYHFHNHSPWGTFHADTINWANSYQLEFNSLGASIDTNDYVTLYWADETQPGGDTYISKTTAPYDADQATWESAIQTAVYDYGTDDDAWVRDRWNDDTFPIVDGVSVGIPETGWMGGHVYKDEVGTPDDYQYALYWNGTFHWYDWAEPEPPGPGPGGGESEGFGGWGGNIFATLLFIFVCIVIVAMLMNGRWR